MQLTTIRTSHSTTVKIALGLCGIAGACALMMLLIVSRRISVGDDGEGGSAPVQTTAVVDLGAMEGYPSTIQNAAGKYLMAFETSSTGNDEIFLAESSDMVTWTNYRNISNNSYNDPATPDLNESVDNSPYLMQDSSGTYWIAYQTMQYPSVYAGSIIVRSSSNGIDWTLRSPQEGLGKSGWHNGSPFIYQTPGGEITVGMLVGMMTAGDLYTYTWSNGTFGPATMLNQFSFADGTQEPALKYPPSFTFFWRPRILPNPSGGYYLLRTMPNRSGDGTSEVNLYFSSDGQAWRQRGTIVHTIPGPPERSTFFEPNILLTGTNTLSAVWMDNWTNCSVATPCELYRADSTDGGATWSTPRPLTSNQQVNRWPSLVRTRSQGEWLAWMNHPYNQYGTANIRLQKL